MKIEINLLDDEGKLMVKRTATGNSDESLVESAEENLGKLASYIMTRKEEALNELANAISGESYDVREDLNSLVK